MSGATQSIFSGDEAELILIASGYRTISKAAGSYTQEDLIDSTLAIKNLVYLYYVDLGDAKIHLSETIQFSSAGVLEKQVLFNIYSNKLRFNYTVYTTALRDVASTATVYYKIFRVSVR